MGNFPAPLAATTRIPYEMCDNNEWFTFELAKTIRMRMKSETTVWRKENC